MKLEKIVKNRLPTLPKSESNTDYNLAKLNLCFKKMYKYILTIYHWHYN